MRKRIPQNLPPESQAWARDKDARIDQLEDDLAKLYRKYDNLVRVIQSNAEHSREEPIA